MTQTKHSLTSFKYKIITLLSIVIFLIAIWANLAPISSAAIAQGHLRTNGFVKKIQHLNGGIIENIFVTEGQLVQQSEVLIQLETQNIRLALSGKLNQLLHALLQQVHLHGIVNNKSTINFSPRIIQLAETLDKSNRLTFRLTQFKKYQEIEQELKQIYLNQLEKITTAIEGKNLELDSLLSQKNSLQEEHLSYQKLAGDDYLAKQKLLPIERDLSSIQANISRALTSVSQYRLEKTQIELTEKNRISKELHYQQQQLMLIEAELPNLLSDINQLKLSIERSTITSPVSGFVSSLNVHSIQGTIAPQAILMEIVPNNDNYVIEVMLSPDDIDDVELGAKSQIRLTAFNQRKVHMIPAKIQHISPDRRIDEKGSPYYRVELSFNQDLLVHLEHVTLYSGMGAEAYIETGKQTLFDYLFHAFLTQKNKALRDI